MKILFFLVLLTVIVRVELTFRAELFSSKQNDDLDGSSAASDVINYQLTLEKSLCSFFMFTKDVDGRRVTDKIVRKLQPSMGVDVFHTEANNINNTRVAASIAKARMVRQESWCAFVVAVSDDPGFLTAFAKISLKERLLVGSTKFFAFTRLAIHRLQTLREPLSMTNAVMTIIDTNSITIRSNTYVFLPYTKNSVQPLLVATWQSQQGLVLVTCMPLFPPKFQRFIWRPTLVVAEDEYRPHATVTEKKGPDGRAVTTYSGPMLNLLNILASNINFSYVLVRPPDGAWGAKLPDGSWTGMVAMVESEEVDLGLGPFGVTSVRAEVIDYTHPILVDYARILGKRGSLEVDAWGFMLPLSSMVWVGLMVTLLLVIFSILFMSTCDFHHTRSQSQYVMDVLRILLYQDIKLNAGKSWERIATAVWMFFILVVTKSFSGNLMSQLAVRHIPQPYQSIRDVLDDASVTMIWEANSAYVQYYRNAKTGIYRELALSEEEGRIFYQRSSLFLQSFDTQVRSGSHVLIAEYLIHQEFMANDFSNQGRCDFYISREQILPLMFAMVGRKGSLLVPSISERISSMTESGLYNYWLKSAVPNSTSCAFASTKITVNSSLSIRNVWGSFVVLFGGSFIALLASFIELVVHYLCIHRC